MRIYRIERDGDWALPASEALLDASLARGQLRNDVDIVFVQHLLPDTAHYLKVLTDLGFQVLTVYGIEYSTKPEVVDSILDLGIRVESLPIAQIPSALESLFRSRRSTGGNGSERRVLLQEVGGYAANLLARDPDLLAESCLGIVEETRQGLWRYQEVENPAVPIVEIASTRLKRIEATYVGEAVARALEAVLLVLGHTLAGLPMTVLGFGDIGSSCATALRSRGAIVAVYDPDPIRLVEAVGSGFLVFSRREALRHGRVIVGASGQRSLALDDIGHMSEGAVLVSASSKQVEFPVPELLSSATQNVEIAPGLTKLTFENGDNIVLVNEGFPANFESLSLPAFVSDLLFCQISSAICCVTSGGMRPGLHTLGESEQEEIAKTWLNCYFPEQSSWPVTKD